jgi:hypothetical protein
LGEWVAARIGTHAVLVDDVFASEAHTMPPPYLAPPVADRPRR